MIKSIPAERNIRFDILVDLLNAFDRLDNNILLVK